MTLVSLIGVDIALERCLASLPYLSNFHGGYEMSGNAALVIITEKQQEILKRLAAARVGQNSKLRSRRC